MFRIALAGRPGEAGQISDLTNGDSVLWELTSVLWELTLASRSPDRRQSVSCHPGTYPIFCEWAVEAEQARKFRADGAGAAVTYLCPSLEGAETVHPVKTP
jgi:hypothetical protein